MARTSTEKGSFASWAWLLRHYSDWLVALELEEKRFPVVLQGYQPVVLCKRA